MPRMEDINVNVNVNRKAYVPIYPCYVLEIEAPRLEPEWNRSFWTFTLRDSVGHMYSQNVDVEFLYRSYNGTPNVIISILDKLLRQAAAINMDEGVSAIIKAMQELEK